MSLPTPPATKPRILGLDLSLTATGVAMPDGDTLTIRTQPSAYVHAMERLADIRHTIIHLAGRDTDLVAIEGYAYGRDQNRELLGELGGVVKLALYDAAIPYVLVAPTSVKKYATGHGNAPKGLVISELNARTGRTFRNATNDQADAYALRLYALDAYGWGDLTWPATHRSALKSVVSWPDLSGANR